MSFTRGAYLLHFCTCRVCMFISNGTESSTITISFLVWDNYITMSGRWDVGMIIIWRNSRMLNFRKVGKNYESSNASFMNSYKRFKILLCLHVYRRCSSITLQPFRRCWGVCLFRAGFRRGQSGQLPRGPHKKGPPQNLTMLFFFFLYGHNNIRYYELRGKCTFQSSLTPLARTHRYLSIIIWVCQQFFIDNAILLVRKFAVRQRM